MESHHDKIVRNIKLVKKRDGLTDEIKNMIDSFFSINEITSEEWIELRGLDESEEIESED